jgi:DNA-binding CsgD family transcriptional regulator
VGYVSAADYERILAIVAEASRGTPDEPLPGDVLEMIRALARCDVAAYFDGAPADRTGRRVWATRIPVPWTDEERLVVDRCRPDLPLNPSPMTIDRAVRISDTMSQSRYRNLEIYRLAGRRHQIEYSMDYWTRSPTGHLRGLSFDASAHDFSDRTRDAIEVLGRHLRTMLARHERSEPASSPGLTGREAEIVALVTRGMTNRQIGHTLSISPNTVRKHLENAYLRIGVHTRAEAVAWTYHDRAADEPGVSPPA